MAGFVDAELLMKYDRLGIVHSGAQRGRYGVALQPYKYGDLILDEEPYSLTINNPYRYQISGLSI